MSWSANLSGHIQGDVEEAKKLEEELVAKLRQLVSSFEASHGLSSASFNGQHVGGVNLRSDPANGNEEPSTADVSPNIQTPSEE